MSNSRVLTLVFPKTVRDGLADRFQFSIHALWRTDRSGSSAYAKAHIFLAPHLPFSVIPRRLLRQTPVRLTDAGGETELSPFAAQMGLQGARRAIATLRFRKDLSTPRRKKEKRTFRFPVLVPPEGKDPWEYPQLGSDFLLGYRMKLFIDYARLEFGPDPDHLGQLRFDPGVPCGHLEYPGDEFSPFAGSTDAPSPA
jgi:hypothetical protein